jgi:integrase
MGFTTLFYHLKRASPAEVFLFLRLDQIQPSQQPGGAADLIAFGAYTGCRIEELAQLKEVHFIDGAFKVEDSKSAAGIREVPLHPALIGMVNQLTEKAGTCWKVVMKGRSESVATRWARGSEN